MTGRSYHPRPTLSVLRIPSTLSKRLRGSTEKLLREVESKEAYPDATGVFLFLAEFWMQTMQADPGRLVGKEEHHRHGAAGTIRQVKCSGNLAVINALQPRPCSRVIDKFLKTC